MQMISVKNNEMFLREKLLFFVCGFSYFLSTFLITFTIVLKVNIRVTKFPANLINFSIL